eukprot:460417-Rhodomonas_salina.4
MGHLMFGAQVPPSSAVCIIPDIEMNIMIGSGISTGTEMPESSTQESKTCLEDDDDDDLT